VNWRGFAAGFALVLPLTVVGVADAAPTQQASIAVVTETPTLGEPVVFSWSADRAKDPRIQIRCDRAGEYVFSATYRTDANIVLGYPGSADGMGGATGWSLWVDSGGGDADCVARLYDQAAWKPLQNKYPILAAVTFAARG